MMSPNSPFDHFGLPPVWPESLLPAIREHNRRQGTRLAVLDDDPLGGQCVHDVPVLTRWDPALLTTEIEHSAAFLLLTNTRGLPREEAVRRALELGACLRQAAGTAGRPIEPMWRSDSTLRGHFWHEMSAFAGEYLGNSSPRPVFVFIPYFGDGGRYTLNDTQYVLQSDILVPVAETEFAGDPLHAFQHSHLPGWLEAHAGGGIRSSQVVSISIEDLRMGGPDRVVELLSEVPANHAVVVNAAHDRDLEVFVAGLQQAGANGRRFLCSGTASFTRVRAGMALQPLLGAGELDLNQDTGGLAIVGSYVEKTRGQLERALTLPNVRNIELSIDRLIDKTTRAEQAKHASVAIADALGNHEDVILHTPRDFVAGASPLLQEAIASIVAMLPVQPRYLLCKGGSTASHLATGCLGVRRAVVAGQLQPGVPVWRLDEESRWPGLPFVIFAGNVGSTEGLSEALQTLRGS